MFVVDVWSEIIKKIKEIAMADPTFSSNVTDIYFYRVPSSAQKPYVTCFDGVSQHWMTIGKSTSGEKLPIRFVVHTDSNSGGTAMARLITNTLDVIFGSEFETDSFKVISIRRAGMSKPLEDPDNEFVYFQFILFNLILERK